jgi:hypothetical protein
MEKKIKRYVLAFSFPAIALLLFATHAEAKSHSHGRMVMVKILHSKMVHMKKGMARIFIVEMNGHRMIAFPENMVPDELLKGVYDYAQ